MPASLKSAVWAGVALAMFPGPAPAQGPAADPGATFALLIGVEKYQRVTPLRYIANDVHLLADTLHRQGGDRVFVMEMTDQVAPSSGAFTTLPPEPPVRSVLARQLPSFLKRPGPNDRVVVYFSGHGF